MRPGLRLLVLSPLAALLACSSSSPATNGGGFGAQTGGYVFSVAPGTTNASTFTGALNVVGTTVTGVFQYNSPSRCVSSGQDISFSGSVVNNVLTLTSGSFSGSVATAVIQLPLVANTGGTTAASGTIVVAGGTCALASSALTATLVPSVSANWIGTLTGPVSGTGTFSLTQAAANSDGQFPVSGTVSFSSSTCSFSSAVTVAGLVSGYNTQLTGSNLPANVGLTASISTATSPATATISTTNSVTSTALGCPVGSYSGTITHN